MRLLSSASVVLFACLAAISCGSNAELTFPFDFGDADAGQDVSIEVGPPIDDDPLQDGGSSGCKPLTCADQGIECGPTGDGCGGLIECGTCTAPETCGGGGEYSRCGGSSGCVPRTCDDLGAATCGPVADGCGNLIQCGDCAAPDFCGGGGVASQCGSANVCTKKTCADYGPSTCGFQSDGCGGLIDCATCTLPELCGGDPTQPGQCAIPPLPDDDGGTDGGSFCTPKSCDDYGDKTCGPQGDGCGGVISCGGCAGAGELCGGDPTKPGQCSAPPVTCAPRMTCTALECGPVGDGCGGILNCPGCGSGQQCGGPGKPSQCVPVSQCTKKTCAAYPAGTCGQQSDGCGGVITCANCTGVGEECGGDPAKPGLCAVPPSICTPKTCADLGIQCGPAGDGCGGTISCGGCGAGQQCGGAGRPSQCAPIPGCTPRTCAQLGFNCGAAGDGCGGLIPGGCGTCSGGQYCGGNGPGRCGMGIDPGDAGTYPECTGGATTSISGTAVFGRANTATFGPLLPLYNAMVYIPSGPLPSLDDGVTCEQCSAPAGALAMATTGPDGRFTLHNTPSGPSVPLVVQLGKWRRVVNVNIEACVDNELDKDFTRLPRNSSEGDIPKMAIATGNVDAIECVIRKMGVDDDEFAIPSRNKRIALYRDNGASSRSGESTPNATTLWDSATELAKYDVVLHPCKGSNHTITSARLNRMVDYTSAGGRLFATHFSYSWLFNTYSSSKGAASGWGCGDNCTTADRTVAAWDIQLSAPPDPFTATVDTGFPKGAGFADWLQQVGASTTLGQVSLTDSRHDVHRVIGSVAQRWIHGSNPNRSGNDSAKETLQHFTFNTPVNVASENRCGRVVFSDFHVTNASSGNANFPSHCANAPLTAQEKILAFMLLDLTSCIQPDEPPACVPRTCQQLGAACGQQGNGCGGTIDCGTCTAPATCGGGGVPNQCGQSGPCVPKTCTDLGATCGTHGNGCGGTLTCGTCTLPETCGGGGVPNQCGKPACQKLTCGDLGASCGVQGDGCGGTINCGACTSPLTCGGGGVPNQCGGTGCTKITCQALGASCGTHGDGCGGTLDCGTCQAPDTCGGGGTPNQCGHTACVPITCAAQGITCGPASDGCGGQLSCGTCTWPETCGGGGIPGRCGISDGGMCQPISCQDQGLDCGPAGNGCGGILDCGKCQAPDSCGGAGVPGECGHIACIPKTCADLGIACGPAGDGCGGTLQCGTCEAPESCGGGGVAGQCGKPNCTPRTCSQAKTECGAIGDGCGGIVECGTCHPPQTCGGGGKPGVCGGGVK